MEFMFPIDSSLLFAILIVMTTSAYILILKKLRPKSILTKNIPKQDPKKYDPQNQKKRQKYRERSPGDCTIKKISVSMFLSLWIFENSPKKCLSSR